MVPTAADGVEPDAAPPGGSTAAEQPGAGAGGFAPIASTSTTVRDGAVKLAPAEQSTATVTIASEPTRRARRRTPPETRNPRSLQRRQRSTFPSTARERPLSIVIEARVDPPSESRSWKRRLPAGIDWRSSPS